MAQKAQELLMNIEKKLHKIINELCYDLPISAQISIDESNIIIELWLDLPRELLQLDLVSLLKQKCAIEFPSHTTDVILEQEILSHPTQLLGQGLRGVKNVIAVASGKGGVGKSTVAVNLAVSLAKNGAKVGILDADIYGPSIPIMLGATTGVERTEEHYLPIKQHGIYAMSISYLTPNQNSSLIWRGPMLAKSLMHMINLTLWEDLDYLFIDLPPGTGDIQLSLVQKIPLTGAIIVTTPQQVATLDAQKAIHMFKKTNIKILGIIENMSIHTCSSCGHTEHVFGEHGAQKLSEEQECTLLGQLPLDQKIRQDCDQGTPIALDESNYFEKIAYNTAIEIAKT